MTETDDSKSLQQIIRDILATTEEMKSSVLPLIRGHEQAMKSLESHQKVISGLVASVLGTQAEHKEMAEKLEMISSQSGDFEEKLRSHESVDAMLDKRMTLIEDQQVREIGRTIFASEKPSNDQVSTLDGLIGVHPEYVGLLGLKGMAIRSLGDKGRAVKWIDDSIAKHQNAPFLWYARGLVLDESDTEEKLKCFDKALELLGDEKANTFRHEIFYSKTCVLEIANRPAEGLASAEKAVEYSSECPNAWSLKGDLLKELNRIPESLGCFEKALKFNPESAWAWFGKGQDLAILGPDYYDEAVTCFDKAIQFEPKMALAYFSRGDVLAHMDLPFEALDSIEAGLSRDPNDACEWCKKGMILNYLEQYPKAVDSYNKSIELGPPAKCSDVFVYKGGALIKAGRIPDARKWLMSLDEKKFDSAKTLNAYSWALYKAGEFEKGAESARRLVRMDSTDAHFWDTLACNLVGSKSDSDALGAFRKATSLAKSDDAITWDVYSALCERMSLTDEADLARKKVKVTPVE